MTPLAAASDRSSLDSEDVIGVNNFACGELRPAVERVDRDEPKWSRPTGARVDAEERAGSASGNT